MLLTYFWKRLPIGASIWLAAIWLISPNRATHLKSPKNVLDACNVLRSTGTRRKSLKSLSVASASRLSSGSVIGDIDFLFDPSRGSVPTPQQLIQQIIASQGDFDVTQENGFIAIAFPGQSPSVIFLQQDGEEAPPDPRGGGAKQKAFSELFFTVTVTRCAGCLDAGIVSITVPR